jgi:hypothetical protein
MFHRVILVASRGAACGEQVATGGVHTCDHGLPISKQAVHMLIFRRSCVDYGGIDLQGKVVFSAASFSFCRHSSMFFVFALAGSTTHSQTASAGAAMSMDPLALVISLALFPCSAA